MNSIDLPADLADWAELQVAAGRATSIEALAIDALATIRAQQIAIADRLAEARATAERDGWIEGAAALALLDAWIEEDEADAAGRR